MTARRLAGDLALIGVAIGALILGAVPMLVLMAGLAVLATGEVFRLTRATGIVPALAVGFAGALALLVVAHLEGEDAPVFFPIVIAAVFGLSVVAMIGRRDRAQVTDGIAMTIVPVVAIGLLAAYLIALRSGRDGFEVALALTLMAVANDLVSGLVDPRRGRRPLAPTVRPSRTWEGLAAGAAATMLVAVVIGFVMSDVISLSSALILGGVVSAAAPLGDLSRAMFERDLRAELPKAKLPRAMTLRRIDGVLFASPVFFYAFRLLER